MKRKRHNKGEGKREIRLWRIQCGFNQWRRWQRQGSCKCRLSGGRWVPVVSSRCCLLIAQGIIVCCGWRWGVCSYTGDAVGKEDGTSKQEIVEGDNVDDAKGGAEGQTSDVANDRDVDDVKCVLHGETWEDSSETEYEPHSGELAVTDSTLSLGSECSVVEGSGKCNVEAGRENKRLYREVADMEESDVVLRSRCNVKKLVALNAGMTQ
ncbi:hypothetical protein Cgig2_000569 [Carnegiea gigantea]|uniref:Uncharacterized protein n=1 Tax=Carnegiea gigantea TaxID=171969 RepID=A0A9Q1GVN0_9CARY|nr:hypothetical protein Cgig2_032977 [Carnegiea gigantea]KAJ8426374.1 hypothetical protein Cgig2_000569 [Carnegiea gigantea]